MNFDADAKLRGHPGAVSPIGTLPLGSGHATTALMETKLQLQAQC